jgi:hypothetical protein
MEKWLCLGSLGAAGLLFFLFLLDLIVGFPFSAAVPADQSSPFMLVNIAGMLASAVVGYMAWNAYRDVR